MNKIDRGIDGEIGIQIPGYINYYILYKKSTLIILNHYICAYSYLLFHKLVPIHKEQEESKEETDHFISLGGRFKKQGNFYTRFAWTARLVADPIPTGILQVYTQDLPGFSHISAQMVSQSIALSSGVLKRSYSGNCGQNVHSKDRGKEEWGAWIAQVQLAGQLKLTFSP